MGTQSYLLAGQPSELERLHLQSKVWEIAPLARGPEQVAIFYNLVKAGGWLVLEVR